MTTLADRPADAEARRLATTLLEHNVVVTAGAGTGKTSLLIERALNGIGSGLLEIQQIALITFTEKAAAELRSRLAEGLQRLIALAAERAAPGDLDPRSEGDRAWRWLHGERGIDRDRLRGRALRALQGLDAAAVSTIHAFCADILRRFPRLAGVDPSFQIDEGPVFDRLFRIERDRFFAEELGPRPGRGALWRDVLRRPGALEDAEDLARALASFVIPSEVLAPARAAEGASEARRGERLLRAEIESFHNRIGLLTERLQGLTPAFERLLRSILIYLKAFRRGGTAAMIGADAPLSLEDLARTKIGEPGERLSGAEPGKVKEVALRGREMVKALALIDEPAVEALLDVARPLALRARECFLAPGFVSFDALLRLTRDLFARHPEVRRAAAARYRALLVDEFQDTDPLQYEILLFLAEKDGAEKDGAEKDGAAGDAYAARLAPGRLFIVGDPKQSIYRFRGADIEAYARAVKRILDCGGRELSLTSSFRSPLEIVEPINRLFGAWIGPRDERDAGFEPLYEPIDSARGASADGAPRVEIWTIDADGLVESRRRAEAEAIAAWIAGHLGGSAATGRPLRHRDVAILLRALTDAGLYAEALRRAGIPYLVEGGKEFYERAEVGELVAFLRAAADPNDAPSLLAVLRSPLGGTPDTELARFAAAGGRFDPPPAAADPALFPNLARALESLASFRRSMRGRAVDEIVRAVLVDTPLALLHASTFDGAQRLANLRKLVARAGDLARGGLSLEETLQAIEEEGDGARSEGESPLADETLDAVRILSVHKAKGLEYPVVFVPDLGRAAYRSPAREAGAAWLSEGALAVRLADGRTNAAWIRHRESSRRHETAEEKRVFYVAWTRAAERLILVGSTTRGTAPWRDALRALGFDPGGRHADGDRLAGGRVLHRIVAPVPFLAPETEGGADPRWRRAAEEFERLSAQTAAGVRPAIASPAAAVAAPHAGRVAAEIEETLAVPERDDHAPARAGARLAGTVVHAALQGWDFRDAGALRRSAQRQARLAAAAPLPEDDVESRTLAIIDAFLASSLPGRLAGVTVLGREMPILFRDPSGLCWSGAVDLLYEDGDGSLVVADYKTDRVEGDLSERAEAYRPQIRIYAEAVRRAFPGRRVRGEILFLRSGTAVVLVDDAPPEAPAR